MAVEVLRRPRGFWNKEARWVGRRSDEIIYIPV
jgi:hypothetical protein